MPLHFYNFQRQAADPTVSMFYASGYHIGNIVVCCKFINHLKNDFTVSEAIAKWKDMIGH